MVFKNIASLEIELLSNNLINADPKINPCSDIHQAFMYLCITQIHTSVVNWVADRGACIHVAVQVCRIP